MPSSIWTGRRPYSAKHHRSTRSCFRNPCVVFLCSFLALATLRFRVRPKRAAQWIQKHSNHLRREKVRDPIPTSEAAKTGLDTTMEFKLQEEGNLPSGAAFQRYQAVLPENNNKAATIQEWTQSMLSSSSLSTNHDSLQCFLDVLRKNPYKAFFFETRPVIFSQMASKTFEFVLVDAPGLHKFATSRPNPQAFAEYFHDCATGACVFSSLHGDATLIAPKLPDGTTDLVTFSHLADFCRSANPDLVNLTWKLAIQTYVQQLERQSTRNLWFSTSGLGISWLHFRVDQRPKYYTYGPFRDEK